MGEQDIKIERVPKGPVDGNLIAKAKGVLCEEESEGRRRQNPGADEQESDSRPEELGKHALKCLIPTVNRKLIW